MSQPDNRGVPQGNSKQDGSGPVWAIVTMVIEMIPGGLGPYGVGDVVTALEALLGRTLDGLHLSNIERLVYAGASVIPVVPARPLIAAYRMLAARRVNGDSATASAADEAATATGQVVDADPNPRR